MTIIKRLSLIGLIVTSTAALGACGNDYGYGGPAVGYGAGYDGYYDGFGDGGGGFFPGYYGWYGGFYYPGTGIYVYDRYRRPIRWNHDQQRYWSDRQHAFRGPRGGIHGGANWNGFNRGTAAATTRPAGQTFRGGPVGGRPVGGRPGGGFRGGHHR